MQADTHESHDNIKRVAWNTKAHAIFTNTVQPEMYSTELKKNKIVINLTLTDKL